MALSMSRSSISNLAAVTCPSYPPGIDKNVVCRPHLLKPLNLVSPLFMMTCFALSLSPPVQEYLPLSASRDMISRESSFRM